MRLKVVPGSRLVLGLELGLGLEDGRCRELRRGTGLHGDVEVGRARGHLGFGLGFGLGLELGV